MHLILDKEVIRSAAPVVLLYHRLGLPKLTSLVAGQYVAPRLFNSQLDCLISRGWQATSLEGCLGNLLPNRERAVDEEVSGNGFPETTFAITFDDGYLSVYEHAYPAMVKRGITATVYVVAEAIGSINEWDHRAGDSIENMMSAAQIREMADAGFEIASHTLTHPHLTEVSDEQLQHELLDSKHMLEDLIGKPVNSFSYPYGDYDERVINAAMQAGYTNATSTKLGVITPSSSIFEIPRVNVRWNAFGPLLMRKIGRARRASGA